ncbi:MAG TPA: Ig-like domain repeat protein [Acidimicrobiales bacterium]|nr:Ig-like domain repeat protein [Acidimicrobiales bacterium]
MLRSPRGEEGDTLIELLMAIVILSLTVAALFGGLITVITASAEHRSLAAIDTLLNSFSQSVQYQVQLQPQPRSDATAATTNGSPVVTDSAIGASDFGKPVSGTGIPANSYVGTVTPGSSFLLSSAAGGPQANVDATATGTVTAKIGNQPIFLNCPTATSGVNSPYQVVSAPSPTVGPTSSTAILFLSGFVPYAGSNPVTVTVGPDSATVTSSNQVPASGDLAVSFTVPTAGLASGSSYPVIVHQGSTAVMSPTPFTVGSAVTDSSVTGYSMGISKVQQWDGGAQTFASPGSCPNASGIQLVTASASGFGVSGSLSFVVAGNATTLVDVTSAPSNPVLDGTLTFTATVIPPSSATPNPTGNVKWTLTGPNAPSCPNVAVTKAPTGNTSTATCVVQGTNLVPGTYTATAEYNFDQADPNYPDVTSNPDTATVGRYTPTVTVSASPASPVPGATVTFTATITGTASFEPTGQLTWNVTPPSGSAPCSGAPVSVTSSPPDTATAKCVVSGAIAGTYHALAAYLGDSNYAPATSPASNVTVGPVTPTVTVSANPSPFTPGSPVVFTATVSAPTGDPTPTGTVQWTITPPSGTAPTCSNSTLSGGTATCTISSPISGTYTVTAAYKGSAAYNPASGSTTDKSALLITGLTLANHTGGTPGRIDSGDTVTVTFTNPLAVNTICSAWSNNANNQSSATATINVSHPGSGDNVLSVSSWSGCPSFNFGTIDLGSSGYVTGFGSMTFANSTIAYNVAADSITITLGTKGGSGNAGTVSRSVASFSMSGAITDTAGQSVSNSPFSTNNVQQF